MLTSFKSLPYKSPCLLFNSLWLVEEQKGRREGENVFCGKTSLLAFFLLIKYAHGLRAKNQWTGTRTMTAAKTNLHNYVTTHWRVSAYSLHAMTTIDHNVSYFLINQSKTKTFTDLEVTRKPARPVKSLENSTWPYLNEIPPHEDRRLWRHRR